MKSNLDVYTVQHYPEKLFTVLNNINNGVSIIYSNVLSRLLIGDKEISGNFDTVLYNEKSDILILIKRDSKIKKEDIIKYLEDNKKKYVEVTFNPRYISNEKNTDLPEICFARECDTLENAIKDSINKGSINCIYYPFTLTQINLGYRNQTNDIFEIDGRLCKGIIKFDDKVILLINQKDNLDEFERVRNINMDKAMYFFKKYNINVSVLFDDEPDIFDLKKDHNDSVITKKLLNKN